MRKAIMHICVCAQVPVLTEGMHKEEDFSDAIISTAN